MMVILELETLVKRSQMREVLWPPWLLQLSPIFIGPPVQQESIILSPMSGNV